MWCLVLNTLTQIFKLTLGVILKPRKTFVFLHEKFGVGGLKRKKLCLKNSSFEREDGETFQDLISFLGRQSLHF